MMKMMMIGSRSPTLRTVVKEGISGIFLGKIQHVHIPVPDRLVCMLRFCYDKMIGKNRIWIDQNIIFLALAALELEHYLLGRTILSAQEAPALCYFLLAELSGGRDHSCRIELQLDSQTADLNLSHTHVLERTEVPARQRPLRQLVSYKLMYLILFHFILASSSQVRILSL